VPPPRGRRSVWHHAGHLIRPERAAADLGTLRIVESLAERKQLMTESADLFVALPADRQRSTSCLENAHHERPRPAGQTGDPCASDGFWQPFIAMIDVSAPTACCARSVERTLRVPLQSEKSCASSTRFPPQAAAADSG